MSRNLEKEIDDIKQQLEKIKSLLTGKVSEQQKEPPRMVGKVQKMSGMHPDPAIMKILNRLENTCGEKGETGTITYLGVFASGGRQSTWIQNEINTDELLELIENRTAEKVLACIGNNDRLNILLALLRQPMTVAALVEKCGYNSTGQVYHHLKPLVAADLITEDKDSAKGTYIVKPHRVQGIIMLLAGIHDMIDIQYSTGSWGAENEVHNGATMVDERYMVTAEECEKIISTYFETSSPLVLKLLPPKEKKKLVILRVISEQFEKDRRYSETEVNQILKLIHEDYATIRRYLIEYGFMERTSDCRVYWLKRV